jgi:hypothetical protein
MATRFILRSSALVLAATAAAALSGCATSLSSSTATANPTALAANQIGGHLHGGNQPITGAAVTLWAAGSSAAGGAYGKGAIVVGTGITDGNGNFTFNNGSGVSPCITGQYLYVTAVGGNTGAGINPYSALMAALPSPCSSATGGTYVWINEVTTVAAVTALQQFMSINPAATGTTPPWQIGAPGTNVSGMANAFAETSQLASIAAGVSQATAVTNTVAGVVYTTTVAPDAARINTLADILASCVNTPGTSVCTSLFSDATPSGSTAPGDTIQTAYYIATNPAGLTMNAHSAANSPTYLCNTYVTASAPFLPDLTCGTNTNDWVIGVSWKAVNGTTAATTGTIYAASVAIDGSGNIWVGGGTGATAAGGFINEFNQFGQLILNPVSTANIAAYNQNYDSAGVVTTTAYPGATGYALGYARPFGLAIDTAGNAWFGAYGATSPGTLSNTLVSGLMAEVTPGNQTGVATGYISGSSTGALAIDGSNNLYFGDEPNTRYYMSELTASSSYQTLNEGIGRGTGIFNYLFVDDTFNQYAWGFNSSTTGPPSTIARGNTTSFASGTTTASITDPSAFAYYGAPDAVGNAWLTASGNLYYMNIGTSITAPTVTTFTGVTTTGGVGGLDGPTGVAIDGVGNVWVFNRPASGSVGGLSAFVPTVSNGSATAVALSPATAFGFQADGVVGGDGIAIDSSGNLWINTTSGSFLYHVVGAAAPVVTPTALAIANGTLATKP